MSIIVWALGSNGAITGPNDVYHRLGPRYFFLSFVLTTPPCLQMRGGVVLCLFHSGVPPHHHYHPLSLTNVRWGCFLVC
ncbi:hypothetical protein L208DRAFT_911756 [Tricholoma matsutake]|nr:hypothetical protein L208DRAFT_911756 [Tricholoma matsutake 945]